MITAAQVYAVYEENSDKLNQKKDEQFSKQVEKITAKMLKRAKKGKAPYLKIRKPKYWISIMDSLESAGYEVEHKDNYLIIRVA